MHCTWLFSILQIVVHHIVCYILLADEMSICRKWKYIYVLFIYHCVWCDVSHVFHDGWWISHAFEYDSFQFFFFIYVSKKQIEKRSLLSTKGHFIHDVWIRLNCTSFGGWGGRIKRSSKRRIWNMCSKCLCTISRYLHFLCYVFIHHV